LYGFLYEFFGVKKRLVFLILKGLAGPGERN
jgi:hypothetical protein